MHTLGTRAFDESGNEYIYLQGVASTAVGSWVTFDENHATALAVANAVGRIAVAMAAVGANQYGWYQVFGKNTVAKGSTTTADAAVYLTATAGTVSGTDVVGDMVVGAIARSTVSGGVFTAELNYPFTINAPID
ncbi:hypothetical protein [Persephonella sp.]